MKPFILVTGGAGYIGSHVCKSLKSSGYLPVTLDNLSHGHKNFVRYGPLFEGDLQNPEDLDAVFLKYRPKAVIHMASSIHLRESIENPNIYYYNNVIGTLNLLKAMVKHKVLDLIFSSSAAVYAPPLYLPIDENHPKGPLNPYGRTKWIVEQLLEDFHRAYDIKSVSLRYFNAAGSDPEGEIGEAHSPESHLIPLIIMATQGKLEKFSIFSDSLPTFDGTAVRDYVHVSDLAVGHVLALKWLSTNQKSGVFNLGSGAGTSVQEVIEVAKKITGKKFLIERNNQSINETPALIADISQAKKVLGWSPKLSDIKTIFETAINWHESRDCLSTHL